MKYLKIFSFLCFSSSLCLSQVGINTQTPDPDSDLTLGSANKGILLNRVSLTSTNMGVFKEGMLVYNMTTINDVSKGPYISNGVLWNKIVDWPTLTTSLNTVWKTTGNNIASTDFIGTVNLQPLIFKTNNIEKLRLETDGKIGVGTTSPQGVVDIFSTNSTLVLPRNINPIANIMGAIPGMIVYDSTNKTLRYYDGTKWSTVISSQEFTTANEGVVKLNSSGSAKPTFLFRNTGGGGNVAINSYQDIIYSNSINITTDFSSAPTTSWPENIINPTSGDFYNPITNRFLENPISGQVHIWRIIVGYSNKNNGAVASVTSNLSNPVSPSTFSIDQTAIAPNGVSSGNLVFYLITIADNLSIGSGYSLKIKSDTPMDVTIDSITRISQAKD
ncbi:hypothetical protein [Chryseobacterium sp. AG363]|uniref:hypothetical protein n=1 Tax=Chryseobacterium sp. AG363 TaxID=2183997 RepID=UPI000FF2197B|nr:hypothetical protein [Chryseobacterium sp. AG363]RKE77174.1 hypothetical protein DEU39_3937 [Chryseobacterium sp. AG363]